MTVLSLSAELNRRAWRPKYDTGLQSYQSGHLKIEAKNTHLEISNDALTQFQTPETEIKADEIVFDDQGMKFFRNALRDFCKNLKTAKGLTEISMAHERETSSYLRLVFGASSGIEYATALDQINSREIVIPRDYLIFLPDPSARHPSREDIVRALVPFEKTQRQALIAAWDDDTSAIRVRHSGLSKSQLILH